MARFEYSRQITAPNPMTECLAVTEKALQLCGGKDISSQAKDSDSTARLTCTVGKGWAIRLLGALLSPREWIPVRLTVSIVDRGASRELRAVAEENMGFGTLVGVEKKFRARCEELADLLAQNLRATLGQ